MKPGTFAICWYFSRITSGVTFTFREQQQIGLGRGHRVENRHRLILIDARAERDLGDELRVVRSHGRRERQRDREHQPGEEVGAHRRSW
jgi:hypothetical protein